MYCLSRNAVKRIESHQIKYTKNIYIKKNINFAVPQYSWNIANVGDDHQSID